jgi:pimeloyl-ACP methyl ester carboxylesterase
VAQAVAMERADALPLTPFYTAPSLTGTRPGALLREEPFTGYALPAGARAVRILYTSLDAEGSAVATSGVVLIPAGAPPAGGWPVIAWAHGTTGVARECAPSLFKDLVYGEEGVMPMVRAGFAVVATDYHGLGTAGPHQYVNKVAQARDVVYSLYAARTAVPTLDPRWVVVGHSQGGLAAWGVAELEARRLDPGYLGAVSVAGAADLHAVLHAMGTPSSSAAFYLDYMAYAIHAVHPGFAPSRMLDGEARAKYRDVTTQGCWYYAYASFLNVHDPHILRSGWDETASARAFFKADRLAAASARGPLLVVAGEADQTVPYPFVLATVRKACRRGIALTFRPYPGLDHDPTMVNSTPDILAWVRDRFAGKPVEDGCAGVPRSAHP